VGFFGVVRDHAEGRTGVVAVDYEAYDDQVVPRLAELAASARERVPEAGRIVLWHRTGRVRGVPVADRHAEGDAADLEARALGGRIGLEPEQPSDS
jgi:hypothetical protein